MKIDFWGREDSHLLIVHSSFWMPNRTCWVKYCKEKATLIDWSYNLCPSNKGDYFTLKNNSGLLGCNALVREIYLTIDLSLRNIFAGHMF